MNLDHRNLHTDHHNHDAPPPAFDTSLYDGDELEGEDGSSSAPPPPPSLDGYRILRLLSDDYSAAQTRRVARGEQIRAIAQGRDQQQGGEYLKRLGYLPVVRGEKEVKTAADVLLAAILKKQTDEPNAYLATSYRRDWEAERAAFAEMEPALEQHPAWAWMGQVRGVGPTLGAKLLSRLDIDKADSASSFVLYCGLSTVPGQEWWCAKCGYVGIFPETYTVTGRHKGCKELAVRRRGSEAGIRAAMPKAERGEKRGYDAFAKKTLYLLATSWLKAGGKSFYNKVYRDKVAYYDRERPGWEKGRKHYSALRAAEKLFLNHLFEAWCLAIGREPKAPYAEQVLGHTGLVSPVEVLEWEERAK